MPDEWIRQWGDPTLRMTAAPIACIDEVLRGQVKRMRQRLVKADGAGLAATQVGLMRRLFVFRVEPDGDVDVLVNPEVVGRSRETAVFHEGCLTSTASRSPCGAPWRCGWPARTSTGVAASWTPKVSPRACSNTRSITSTAS